MPTFFANQNPQKKHNEKPIRQFSDVGRELRWAKKKKTETRKKSQTQIWENIVAPTMTVLVFGCC